jgi:hypothetical protein
MEQAERKWSEKTIVSPNPYDVPLQVRPAMLSRPLNRTAMLLAYSIRGAQFCLRAAN